MFNMQEELNQFVRNQLLKSITKKDLIIKTHALITRLESIKIYIQKEVYITQLPDFESFKHPNHIYKLKRVMHGLKQASRS
ncbi:hypothetical protein CR513_59358, partial [Mucuna pruriens]